MKTKHDGKVTVKQMQAPQKQAAEEEDRGNHKEDLEQLKMFLKKFFPDRTRATSLEDLEKILAEDERDYILPTLQ